jgi:hypothetical protein
MKAVLVVDGKKRCSRCEQDRPVAMFDRYRRSPSGLAGWCKPCAKQYREPSRDAHRVYVKKHYEANRDLYLARTKVSRYKITLEEYRSLCGAQNDLCAICSRPETRKINGRVTALSVDHDHATGKVRGLLCHGCNVGLGGFRDQPELLVKAINYLREG